MDFTESTKVVYSRVQKLEPENVTKIIGYLLLQEYGETEMTRLAFGPDNLIYSLIGKAKSDLGLSKPAYPTPLSPLQVNSPSVNDQSLHFPPYSPSSSPGSLRDHQHAVAQLQNQMRFLNVEAQLDPFNSDFPSSRFYAEHARTGRRSPSLPEFPLKICHYFNKGFCKHGNTCRYFHGNPMPDSFSQLFSPGSNEDDHLFSPQSLAKLELEIAELLKSRRGIPVSIASLPMLYYDRYGKTLQAEGYLTESQRHGKAGYSLTKLLARLKHSIRLVDRPHGQHSVILVEDVPKYLEYNNNERNNDHGGVVVGSRQIYLTFPAESTFTEQDVCNYFSRFGAVQDVRIPCQQKRMFGFVTFVFGETVKQILEKGNPHFVCSSRVLVKPYREKSKLVDSKKMHHPMCYNQQFVEEDPEFYSSMARVSENSRILSKHMMDEHAQAFELEQMHLLEQQMSLNHSSYLGHSINNEWKRSQGFPSAEEGFSYLLDVFNNGSNNDEKTSYLNTSFNDPDSNNSLNLPDSPFASPIRSGISTAI